MKKTLVLILLLEILICSEKVQNPEKKILKEEQEKPSIQKEEQKPPKDLFIKNLALKKLPEFSKKHEYVIIGFIDPESEKGDEIKKIINDAYEYYADKKDIFFCTINQKKLKKSSKKENKISSQNEIHLKIKNHHKIFKGEINLENFEHWIYEIFQALPIKKNKLQNIERIDSHFFLFCEEEFYNENKKKIDILSKLIHPIIIYYGFEEKHYEALIDAMEENEENLKKKKTSENKENENEEISTKNLYYFREYNFEIYKIPQLDNLNETANFIEEKEFPDYMEVNDASMRLVFDLKIPTLIYFSEDLQNDLVVKKIKNLAKNFKEYFLTIFVDGSLRDDDFHGLKIKYFINILKIDKFPALRIFDASKNLKKYKFIGNFEDEEILFFMKNFKLGHLKSYQITEKLTKKNKKIGELEKVNFKKMKKILKDIEITYLVYVYGSFIEKNYLKNHFKLFEKIQNILKRNKYFQIVIFDHDKNDLDGNFYNHIPFLFLAKRNNTVQHYVEDELDEESVLKWLDKHIPYLKIDKFEVGGL